MKALYASIRSLPAVLALIALSFTSCGKGDAGGGSEKRPGQGAGSPAKAAGEAGERDAAPADGAGTPDKPRPDAGSDAPRAPVHPAALHVQNAPDRWYRVDREGKPTGYIHVNMTIVTQGGRTLVRDVTEVGSWYHRKISHMNDIFTSKSRYESLRGLDGELVSTKSETEEGRGDDARKSFSSLDLTPGGYVYSVRITRGDGQLGDEIRKTHEPGQKISLDAESFLIPRLLAGEFEGGQELSYYALGGEQGVVFEMKVRKTGVEKIPVLGKEEECSVLEVASATHGSSHREWYRADGLLVKLSSGDETTVICAGEDIASLKESLERGAVNLRSPVRDSGLHTWPDLHGAFNLRTLVVDVTVQRRDGVPPPPFADSPFMEVVSREEEGDGPLRYRLKLKAHRGEGKTATLPIDPKGFERELEATALMQVGAPEVMAAARMAVGEEKDARKAAEKIAEFVFTTLEKESGSVGQYSAVEILKNGYGDCSEHALLFVALCRAAGIPARQVSGYVCLGDQWGNHAWGEIWVGEWIGADACTCDVGTTGRYIFFGYPDDPKAKTGVVSQAFTGYAGIRLIEGEFGDGDALKLTGGAKLSGVTPEGMVFSHLSGVAFIQPEQRFSPYASTSGFRVSGKTIFAAVSVRPDQGYRQTDERSRFAWGRKVEVHGYPGFLMQGMAAGANIMIFSERRLIQISVSFRSGSKEEREAEWKTFFERLDLTAWKGRDLDPGGTYPAYDDVFGASSGGGGEEPGEDGEDDEPGGGGEDDEEGD